MLSLHCTTLLGRRSLHHIDCITQYARNHCFGSTLAGAVDLRWPSAQPATCQNMGSAKNLASGIGRHKRRPNDFGQVGLASGTGVHWQVGFVVGGVLGCPPGLFRRPRTELPHPCAGGNPQPVPFHRIDAGKGCRPRVVPVSSLCYHA